MALVEILIVVVMILANGALAMSELALVSARRPLLESLAARGQRSARTALRLMTEPGRFLATVQIGITLVGVLAGAFGGATIAQRLGRWLDGFAALAPHGVAIATAVVVLVISYATLIAGELVPKRIGLRHPERVALLVARPMRLLSAAAAPAVWLLDASSNRLLALLGLSAADDTRITEQEVRSLIAEGTRAGVFAPRERELIDGVLRLADRPVHAIMTLRVDIAWLDAGDSHAEHIHTLRTAGHSRLPVGRGSLDDIVGIAHARDLLPEAMRDGRLDLMAHLRPALTIRRHTTALAALDHFQRSGVHLALVVDELGSTEGIVTTTDILESIAGDMPDRGEEPGEPDMVVRGDGSWLVDGSLLIDEFAHRAGLFGLETDSPYRTMAGFVLHHLGHLPTVGDHFRHGGLRVEVVDMDGLRIDRILVNRVDDAETARDEP